MKAKIPASQKQAPIKKAPAKKRVAKTKAPKKKRAIKQAPKKKSASHSVKKRRARSIKLGPIPKYHIDHKSWDKPAVMTAMCEELMNDSKGMAYICTDNDEYPTIAIVHKWWADEVKAGGSTPLLDMYTHAKAAQMDYLADEGIHIADNETSEPLVIDGVPLMVDGKLIMTTTSASVQKAKLRIESRRWVAERLAHRKYGNKLELSGDPERPLGDLSEAQLIARQKVLEDKLANGA